MVLTPKHLIILLNNGKFEWVIKYDPSNLGDQEFPPFKLDKSYLYDDEKIITLMYNHIYTRIFAGTEGGSVVIFDVPAETFDYEEDDQE